MTNLAFLKTWHQVFFSHLEYVVDGFEDLDLDPVVVADETACRFGQWLIAFQPDASTVNCVVELTRAHKNFHSLAGQVVQHYMASDLAASKSLIDPLREASLAVSKMVDSLENHLLESNPAFDPSAARFAPEKKLTTIWDDALLLGIPVIDQQHQEIAKLVDKFLAGPDEALTSEAGSEFLADFQRLLALHFTTEEVMMGRSASLNSGSVVEHKGEHTAILDQFANLIFDLAISKKDIHFSEILPMVETAVIDHIINFDLALKN